MRSERILHPPSLTAAHPRRALVVDDDPGVRLLVVDALGQVGFVVAQAPDGLSALDQLRREPADLVVLDLGLPDMGGLEVCRQLRTFTDAYVLILSARAEETDRLLGLGLGADDYLTKPFSVRELAVRAEVLMRRPRAGGARPPVQVGELSVDIERRRVFLAGQEIDLTRIEFDLLAILAETPGRVVERAEIMRRIWGPTWYGRSHVIDVHLSHLRRKLRDDHTRPRYLETIRGVGMRLLS